MDQLITPSGILTDLKVTSKKQALQEIAHHAAQQTGQHERAIFDVLLARERLGSTAIGHGVAIPHGRMTTIAQIYGLFVKLPQPIDFDASDNQPVDLLFLLLAPEQAGADHLKALARISRLLKDPETRTMVRACTNADAIYTLFIEKEASATSSTT